MTTEQEQVLRRIVLEGFGAGDLDVIDLLVAERVTEHQYGMSGDREGLKRAITGLRQHSRISPTPWSTRRTTARRYGFIFRARGTHLGPFQGRSPTGRTYEIDVIDVGRVKDGRLVEHWGVPDRFALLDQLGLLNRSDQREEARA